MINETTLEDAIAEAQRFLQRAETLQVLMRHGASYPHNDQAQGAAVKRASMDLTRALAKLRSRE